MANETTAPSATAAPVGAKRLTTEQRLKGKFQRMYMTKNQQSMFVFTLAGTAAALAAYKTAQGGDLEAGAVGNFYRVDSDTNQVLFITGLHKQPTVDLIITPIIEVAGERRGGRVVIDNAAKVMQQSALLEDRMLDKEAELLVKMKYAGRTGAILGNTSPVLSGLGAFTAPQSNQPAGTGQIDTTNELVDEEVVGQANL